MSDTTYKNPISFKRQADFRHHHKFRVIFADRQIAEVLYTYDSEQKKEYYELVTDRKRMDIDGCKVPSTGTTRNDFTEIRNYIIRQVMMRALRV